MKNDKVDEPTFLAIMDLFDGMLDERDRQVAMNTLCMVVACACINADVPDKMFSEIFPRVYKAALEKYTELRRDCN